MSIPYERIVKEDLNLGYGTAVVSMPGGGTALGTKIGLHTFTEGLNVKDFGAKGDGVTDDTAAIQATIAAVLAQTGGGTVFFPPGTYNVTELDLHNEGDPLGTSIRLVGSGRYATVLKGTKSGAILIDAIGRCYLSIEDLRITTDGTVVYQTALLLARRTGGSAFCRNGIFSRVTIWGEFSIATVVSIASEINTWTDCELANDDATNKYCCFFTGHDNTVAGVTSTHGTIYASIANTFNMMHHVTWYAPYAGATPIIMHTGAQYTMVGCSVQGNTDIGSGITAVTYIEDGGGPGGGFLGPVNWISTLWEFKSGVVHLFETRDSAIGYFNSISDVGGAFTIMGAAATNYVMKTTGNPGCLITCRVEDVRYYGGAASTLDIKTEYVAGSRLDIWTPAFDSTITVSSGRTSSFLRAKTLTIPDTDVGFEGFPATVLPERSYAEVGHTHHENYEDLSAGAIPYYPRTETVTDGGMETWGSATNLTNWTETVQGTSSLNREASVVHGGTYACRLDIDASNNLAQLAQTITLVAGRHYHLSLWYKLTVGKAASVLLRNAGGNVWLHPDGTWGTTALGIGLTETGAWTEFTFDFEAHASYTSYTFYFGAGENWGGTAASSSVYLDDVSLYASALEDVVKPLLATGTGKTVDEVITALQTLGLVKQS